MVDFIGKKYHFPRIISFSSVDLPCYEIDKTINDLSSYADSQLWQREKGWTHSCD